MTDIHTLSDTELNERIAKAKGWKREETESFIVWVNPRGNYAPVPDFTHSWELAGGLLEEMARDLYCKREHINSDGFVWKVNFGSRWHQSAKRAICEAYAEWKGL